MKKLWMIVLMCIVFSSLVYAATDTTEVTDVFKINDQVNYAKPCFNNGTYCSSSAKCNFTIYKPDNTVLVDNKEGTNNVNNHNYTLYFTDLGLHKIDMTCVDGARTGAETFYAQVTGSGLIDNLGFQILVIGLSFGVILLGFYLKDGWVVVLGTFGLYFLGIYILFNGIAGVKDLVTTWAIGLITLGIAGYISIRSAHDMITG